METVPDIFDNTLGVCGINPRAMQGALRERNLPEAKNYFQNACSTFPKLGRGCLISCGVSPTMHNQISLPDDLLHQIG
eukprot:793737-Pelagomonas_calceolata.AAC.6